ncbi:hypothetical protein J1N35_022276 [Gossypium stocksii]|uniref:Retrovirus-related Pol polyprotein from transposon TNT 1-94-like beta-barrel domain-containing protein n=1 Tax=Gossypium stocksii TaxID=47602 RepID=A0A9D3VG56_9ROSI|nr:hypothetical protein J1N35_022276 [Gossypium stocksii]
MAAAIFEIEKFDGKTNFNLWQVRMMAILVQSVVPREYGIAKGIDGKHHPPYGKDVAGANLANESSDDFLLVSTSDNSKLTSEWILDSECSFHMCPNREWFSTYSSVEGEVVPMENDSSSKVIGIGTVKIRIHDGTIRTLSDVRVEVNSFGARQLGHRREKGMTVSLKRGFLLDVGFEKLRHYIRDNQTRVNLAVYKSKARSLPVSKHRFDSINSLHSSR